MRRWSVALAIGLIASLLAAPVTGHEGEDGTGGNNLSIPVIFAEGYGLSGIAVDPEVITSTGMPGLLKSACEGTESFTAGTHHVTFPSPETDLYRLNIDGDVFDEQIGHETATPGHYYLQPYSLALMDNSGSVTFGSETCWEADWASGTTLADPVEVTMVDVGDSLVRVARRAGSNPVRVEFTLYQTADTPGIFQEGLELSGYPMTQLWPPAFSDGKPPSVGEGERIEVWGIADNTKVAAEAATVFTQNARLTLHALTWDVVPDSVSDGDLTGYPTGVIPDTFDPGYSAWIESVEYDGLVGATEGDTGFGSEVNQGGKVLFGYNWGLGSGVDEGWYRVTLSLDDVANEIAANAELLGVNPADQLADESDGGSDMGLKGFFPPTFVDDPQGAYLFVDVYIAPAGTGGGGGGGDGGNGKMNGKVTTTGGTSLEDIHITVYEPAGAPVAAAVTDADGLFEIGLPPGSYHVEFTDPGGDYRTEFFDNKNSRDDANDVVVTGDASVFLDVALSTTAPPGGGGGGYTPPTQVLGLLIPFSDVDESNPFHAEIMWMYQQGITKGCEEGKFCPEQHVLRAQIAAMFTRALQLGVAPGSDPFDDDNGWALEAEINFAYQAGITNGCQQGKFCPGQEVTRAQIASMFVRALGLTAGADVDAFTDDDGWSHEADINRLAYAGITLGCEDGKFCPGDMTTRAQVAAMFHRALGS